MRDLLSKDQYCYKIHASLMENSAPPSIDKHPNINYPSPNFHKKKNLDSPFYDFQKI